MKLFAISGSPNRSGTSSTLAKSLFRGVEDAGAELDHVNVYDYKITDVWENYFNDVLERNFEKANDDMAVLKQKMLSADITVLISPVYAYHVSGRLKTFLDRLTDFVNPDFSTELKGKGLALVSSHAGVNFMNSSAILQTSLRNSAEFLGMEWLGGVDAPSRMPNSSGMNEGHVLIAEDFGKKLARGENLIGMKVLS